MLSESGGAGGVVVQPVLPANAGLGGYGPLSSVSCASPGNCTAVGSYSDSSGHRQGLLLTESGGTWGPGVEAALPTDAGSDPEASLSSVACSSPGNCTAVGSYRDGSLNQQGLLLTQSAGTWGAGVKAAVPSNASSNPSVALHSVSCWSPGNCSAVGSYNDNTGDQNGLLLSQFGGTWAPGQEVTLPANAGKNLTTGSVLLNSVSCPSAGNCVAVGQYADRDGVHQGLLLTQATGAWEAGVEATLPAATGTYGGADLSSVSCPSASECIAVGTYNDGYGRNYGLLVGSLAVLSRLRIAPKAFVLSGRKVNGSCVKQTARNLAFPGCTRSVKMTVSYQLNIPAGVKLTFKRVLPGRLNKGRCVAPSAKNRTRRRCTRLPSVRGTLTKSGTQGANSFTFHGRPRGRELGPGTYQLTATPSFGSPRTLTFRITS